MIGKKGTKKQMLLLAAALIAVIIIVPSIVVIPFRGDASILKLDFFQDARATKKSVSKKEAIVTSKDISVAVYQDKKEKVVKVDLEKYVYGVVAAEMPAQFKAEALKAQAVAARTYIYQILKNNSGTATLGADVTDTVQHQVYLDDAELKKRWKESYEKNRSKLVKIINSTKGQIITYNSEPITTVSFFSTSNGFTENSEDYWSNKVPYLRSVESPWDKESPKYKNETALSVSTIINNLGLETKADIKNGKIISQTEGGRVERVQFGNNEYSGREVRDKLKLASSDFTWRIKGENVVFTTYGNGHGVGMSQYGAEGMAKEGANYKKIIEHYYTGVSINKINSGELAGK